MRTNKDLYWMNIAREVAAAATCKRRKVGAVLTRNNRIISSGYNGSPEGLEHCVDVGCDMVNGHCVRTVHAEANVLIQAGLDGSETEGTTLYTIASPCRACMGLIINARVKRVVYVDPYRDPTHEDDQGRWALNVAAKLGIEMIQLGNDGFVVLSEDHKVSNR